MNNKGVNMDHARGCLEAAITEMYKDITKRTGGNVLDRTTLVDAMMKFMEIHLECAYQDGMKQRAIADAKEKAVSGKYTTYGRKEPVEAQQFTALMMREEAMRDSWPKGVIDDPHMLPSSWGYNPIPVIMRGDKTEHVMPGDWIVVDGRETRIVHPYLFEMNYHPVVEPDKR